MPLMFEELWLAILDLSDKTGDGSDNNDVYRGLSLQISSLLRSQSDALSPARHAWQRESHQTRCGAVRYVGGECTAPVAASELWTFCRFLHDEQGSV